MCHLVDWKLSYRLLEVSLGRYNTVHWEWDINPKTDQGSDIGTYTFARVLPFRFQILSIVRPPSSLFSWRWWDRVKFSFQLKVRLGQLASHHCLLAQFLPGVPGCGSDGRRVRLRLATSSIFGLLADLDFDLDLFFVMPAVSSPSCYEKLWPVVKLVMGLVKRFNSLQCFHNHWGAGVTVTVQFSCDFFTTAMSGGFILTAMWPHLELRWR